MCDGNVLSRAPEIRIGLVNDTVWIDISNCMPEMDMMLCEP